MDTNEQPARKASTGSWHTWEQMAFDRLKRAMKERGATYKMLSRELELRWQIRESPAQLCRKVNRKRFSAAFLLACESVIRGMRTPVKPGAEDTHSK